MNWTFHKSSVRFIIDSALYAESHLVIIGKIKGAVKQGEAEPPALLLQAGRKPNWWGARRGMLRLSQN
jgi:hypothetical protein